MAPALTLYHCPRTCSQVTLCALEEAGLAYDLRLVDIRAGDQFKPEFLAISPLNKIPAAVIDGKPLTENAAILTYVARAAPRAGILPGADADPWLQAQAQSGLAFCGGTLHPQLRGLMAPQRLTTGQELEAVRERSAEQAHASFAYAERRIARDGWWLGDWSIVDVYLNWTFEVALRTGFDGSAYPALGALHERLAEAKPSFRRMLELDAECFAKLSADTQTALS